MNARERAVLVFLAATFLVGAGISTWKRVRRERLASMSPITIENPADTTAAGDLLIDLNRAAQWELEALPGIGPVLARRIVDYRERLGGFTSKEQLLGVTGIGPKRYAAIKELVVIGPAKDTAPEETARTLVGSGQ